MSHVLPSVNPKPAGFVELIGGLLWRKMAFGLPFSPPSVNSSPNRSPKTQAQTSFFEKNTEGSTHFFQWKKITKKTWGGVRITNPKNAISPIFHGKSPQKLHIFQVIQAVTF